MVFFPPSFSCIARGHTRPRSQCGGSDPIAPTVEEGGRGGPGPRVRGVRVLTVARTCRWQARPRRWPSRDCIEAGGEPVVGVHQIDGVVVVLTEGDNPSGVANNIVQHPRVDRVVPPGHVEASQRFDGGRIVAVEGVNARGVILTYASDRSVCASRPTQRSM